VDRNGTAATVGVLACCLTGVCSQRRWKRVTALRRATVRPRSRLNVNVGQAEENRCFDPR
jgi:hypothetical protein